MAKNRKDPSIKRRIRPIEYPATFKIGQYARVKGTNIVGEIVMVRWTKTRLNASIWQVQISYFNPETKRWKILRYYEDQLEDVTALVLQHMEQEEKQKK